MPDSFDDAKARAVAWLTAWDSQGVHRTGTTGDEAGALWLPREAAGLGVEVTSEVFELNRLDPVACSLELDGERISGVPAFDAPATGATGVIGTLSLSGHPEAVLIAQLSPRSVYMEEYERLRRGGVHEDVLPAAIHRDEAEAPGGVVPLHRPHRLDARLQGLSV